MKKLLHVALVCLIFIVMCPTFAEPVTGVDEFDQGFTRINFDELTAHIVPEKQYASTGVTIRGTSGLHGDGPRIDVVTTNFFDVVYIGSEGSVRVSSIIFDFSSPISQFAAFIIDPEPSTIAVYDSQNELIERVALTDTEIEGFAGIDSGETLIRRVIISGQAFGVNEILFNNPGATSDLDVQFIPSSDWGAGYCGNLSITNTGNKQLSHWQVKLNTNASTIFDEHWNAQFSALDSRLTGTVTISSLDWNKMIATGQTNSTAGFCAVRADPNSDRLPFIESATAKGIN